MIVIPLVLLLKVAAISSEEYVCDVDRYIISCRSTDVTCFQRQFQYLRDISVGGCQELGVPEYQHYLFQYGDTGTCVKMSGVEASQLVGISYNGFTKLLTLTVSMPVQIQQLPSAWSLQCQVPDSEFKPIGPNKGPYNKFTCNATMVLQFPLHSYKEKGHVASAIEDEELEVVLDVPDLRGYDRTSRLETQIYRSSEWAYEVVKRVNVPDRVMVPFMQRLKTIYNRLPLHRFIQLYPTERYSDLIFKYNEDKTNSIKNAS